MIGEEEKRAVLEVLESGILSDYLANWGDKFMGGPQVQALEREWAEYFDIKHAVAVNSATSGLYAAMGAIGIQPGDEVIVSPYSMVASASAPLVYGGVPVFADIDEDIFCITPESIEANITDKTKAIIAVDLFGHPADMNEIMAIADEHGLVVVEDAAQAPGAMYHGRYAGTLGHIGVFSLNYHKTIHCGEGGVVVTNDDELALRLQLIRNHAEGCTADLGKHQELLGFNYRLTEIQAAIARVQLGRLEELHAKKRYNALKIDIILDEWPASVIKPHVRSEIIHGWYLYAIKAPIIRQRKETHIFWDYDIHYGYVKPIYLEPLFHKYARPGTCPVAERMYYEELIYVKFS